MSIQVIAFAFGGLLLFVGLVGGGFEVKELKIPKVGAGVRVMSIMMGVLFVCLGFSQPAAESQQTARDKSGAAVHDGRGEDPVEFTLSDQLGEGEVSEQVTVLVDGKDIGNLTVNEEYPSSKLLVAVARPGRHSYTAEASAVFNDQGAQVEYRGAGQGIIDVHRGKNYNLRGSVTGSTWLVSLEEEQ